MSVASFPETAPITGSRPLTEPWLWRGRRYIVEIFDGADDALDALEAVQSGPHRNGRIYSTGFQSLNWLTVFYEELAHAKRAMPRVVVVTDRNSGDVALVLPLVISKKNNLTVARFADLGVANYGGPLLGPAVPDTPRAKRRLWRAVRQALSDVDLIRLENMPHEIGGVANPLVVCRGTAPSRRNGMQVTVSGSVEDYLDGLGKKYRREVERCTRLWQREGAPCFSRARRPEDIARAFSVLEEQQAARLAHLGDKYLFNKPAYRQFYERLVMDGSEVDLCHLFTLEAGGEIIATLLAVEHEGTATVLRTAHAGDAWNFLSPGRLICVEALRYFLARGVRRFDLGRGETEFKSGFGAEVVPLFDIIVARDLAAMPSATFHRVKGRARKNPRLRGFAKQFSRLIGR